MTNSRTALLVPVLALILANCAEAQTLAGSEWKPVSIGAMDIPPRADMFLRFGGDGKLQGHGGCNRFFGSYEYKEGAIEIGRLASTRRACPEPIMERESVFLQALQDARHAKRNRITLSLTNETNVPIIELIQTDAD